MACRIEEDPPLIRCRLYLGLDRPKCNHLLFTGIQVGNIEVKVSLLGYAVGPTGCRVVRIELKPNIGPARNLQPNPIDQLTTFV